MRRTLANAPRWAKQVGGFLVGAAAVAGGVAALAPLLRSSAPATLAVRLSTPEWAAQNITLGGYLDWQRRESRTLGLRPAGGGGAASGQSSRPSTKLLILRLAAYATPLEKAGSGLARPAASAAATATSQGAPTAAGGSSAPAGAAASETTSTPSSPANPPGTQQGANAGQGTSNSNPPATPGTTTGATGAATGLATLSGRPLQAEVLREASSSLSQADLSDLQRKLSRQEAIIRNPGSQANYAFLGICQGVGFGGCAPEAQMELRLYKREGAARDSHTELLEVADGARRGHGGDASAMPPSLAAGLSASQRAQLASVLGNAVSFEVHTEGWIGQQLWLTWTMYERRDGGWNPSSRPYLINHAEVYVVPTASSDEGILTFWFPIPDSPGEYQVRYCIRAPRTGLKLAQGKTPSFR